MTVDGYSRPTQYMVNGTFSWRRQVFLDESASPLEQFGSAHARACGLDEARQAGLNPANVQYAIITYKPQGSLDITYLLSYVLEA
jgi:hypothetical protein